MPRNEREALRCIERHADAAASSLLLPLYGLETFARTTMLHAALESVCGQQVTYAAIGRSVTTRAARRVARWAVPPTLAESVGAVAVLVGPHPAPGLVLRIWGRLFLAVAANGGAPLTKAQARRALAPVLGDASDSSSRR